ncbi:hypothetical protein H8356DRAFT_1647005 [Neocallimastix lanati (nom. inval.)]|nr:hypothetical protein H8356DRAFT_1647005 [Neocallimastix sp. JGI-2020a]
MIDTLKSNKKSTTSLLLPKHSIPRPSFNKSTLNYEQLRNNKTKDKNLNSNLPQRINPITMEPLHTPLELSINNNEKEITSFLKIDSIFKSTNQSNKKLKEEANDHSNNGMKVIGINEKKLNDNNNNTTTITNNNNNNNNSSSSSSNNNFNSNNSNDDDNNNDDDDDDDMINNDNSKYNIVNHSIKKTSNININHNWNESKKLLPSKKPYKLSSNAKLEEIKNKNRLMELSFIKITNKNFPLNNSKERNNDNSNDSTTTLNKINKQTNVTKETSSSPNIYNYNKILDNITTMFGDNQSINLENFLHIKRNKFNKKPIVKQQQHEEQQHNRKSEMNQSSDEVKSDYYGKNNNKKNLRLHSKENSENEIIKPIHINNKFIVRLSNENIRNNTVSKELYNNITKITIILIG